VNSRPWTRAAHLVALCALSPLLFACTASPAEEGGKTSTDSTGASNGVADKAPTAVARVCGHTRPGPKTAPSGAVTVDAAKTGDLVAKTRSSPAGTTFWLAPGTHRLGDGAYDQLTPKDGDVFVGAPGAVLDGQRVNNYAFVGGAKDVTIRNLTVRGFVSPPNEGVINHDSADGWVIEDNTITENSGAGLMAGTNQRMLRNCMKDNGQYGLNAYKAGRLSDLVLEGNEIVGNNTDDWEAKVEGCGCTGGVKFWSVDKADVRGNWVHDNRGPGLWGDTNNNDFLIEKNVIEKNDGSAIFYEVSYNAVIRNNTIRGNNLVDGKGFADRSDSFPSAAIYLSESGGEPRVKARTAKLEVYGNVLTDNWSGITLWENADRYCNSPSNTSNDCTLIVGETKRCSAPNIEKTPLLDDCRWKTQNVDIHDNKFAVDPAKIGCDSLCARMAVLSNYGTYPDWSPYKGDQIQESITFDQHNTWHDNEYIGPWAFMVRDTSTLIRPDEWQSSPYSQDKQSSFVPAGG
jgi:hypothetical protein